MMADYKRLMNNLKDQYADSHEWNTRYKAAFKSIHGAELGSLINAMQKPLDLGMWCVSCTYVHHLHGRLTCMDILCDL